MTIHETMQRGLTEAERAHIAEYGSMRIGWIRQCVGNSGVASLDDEWMPAYVSLDDPADVCEDCEAEREARAWDPRKRKLEKAFVTFTNASDWTFSVCLDHLAEDEYCEWTAEEPPEMAG